MVLWALTKESLTWKLSWNVVKMLAWPLLTRPRKCHSRQTQFVQAVPWVRKSQADLLLHVTLRGSRSLCSSVHHQACSPMIPPPPGSFWPPKGPEGREARWSKPHGVVCQRRGELEYAERGSPRQTRGKGTYISVMRCSGDGL